MQSLGGYPQSGGSILAVYQKTCPISNLKTTFRKGKCAAQQGETVLT